MIMKKIGEDFYNGTRKDVWLVYGTATRDAEDRPVNGTPHVTIGIALGQNENGEPKYLTVDAWRGRAADLKGVLKGDAILAIGTVETHEYNEKTYTNFNALWIGVSGGKTGDYASMLVLPGGVFVDVEDDDDGELPFD